jgi:hypothetical protein
MNDWFNELKTEVDNFLDNATDKEIQGALDNSDYDYYKDIRSRRVRINKERMKHKGILGEFQDDLGIKKLKDKMKALEAENARLHQFVKDTVEGFECLDTCDSYGHDDLCPVVNPVEAWRRLREENARLREAFLEYARHRNDAKVFCEKLKHDEYECSCGYETVRRALEGGG